MPGASDTHVAEFFPWFVTEASGFGDQWGVHHYGIEGHKADKEEDEADLAALASPPSSAVALGRAGGPDPR